MKILNLYAGIGGNRKLWGNRHEITAIELDPIIASCYQKNFPDDKVIVEDVFSFIRFKANDINQYDLIWASPPCQSHSQMQKFHQSKIDIHPIPRLTDIYGLYYWLNHHYQGQFCIENVQPWYKTPIKPSFKVGRHCFWANFTIPSLIIKENKWKHGKVGGIARTSFRQFIKKYGMDPSFIEDIPDKLKRRQVVRNCVDPSVGKYVLDHLTQDQTLLHFFI